MRSLRTVLWVLVVVPAACVSRPSFEGPMPTRNQHPAQLLVMHMPPAAAGVLGAGRATVRTNAAYTSLYLFGVKDTATWQMDGEYLRAATELRLGLGAGLQLGVEVAAAHTSGGFLDDFLIGYHDALGLPDQGRDQDQKDAYRVAATRDGRTVWEADQEGAALLDLPITLTWQVLEGGDRRVGVAVRGGVELPTGDERRGFGSGGLDASVGALVDYRLPGLALYGHAQYAWTSTPDQAQRAGLRFGDVTSVGVAGELPLDDTLTALVQIEWETSTLRHLGPSEAAHNQLLGWFGGRLQASPGWSIELAIGEDLRGYASPDVTAWLGMTWKL
ncbi:MAG: DUF3187 family protein [Planctomycetes bacterium]|nr:DUF3187 family protein [Planctomycetota bacterium]